MDPGQPIDANAAEEMGEDLQAVLPTNDDAMQVEPTPIEAMEHEDIEAAPQGVQENNAPSANVPRQHDGSGDQEMDAEKGDAPVAEKKSRCVLKELSAVFRWEWDKNAQVCGICRSYLAARCMECEVAKRSQAECVAAKGICNHVFHQHCIAKWIVIHNTCPVDSSQWKYQTQGLV